MFARFTLRSYTIVALLSLIIVGSLGSCSSSKTMAQHSWTDLNHAKELDRKKGKRSKKYQKNIARSDKY